MLLLIVFGCGAFVVILLLLYLVSSRFSVLGESLAFVCVVGARLFVCLQEWAQKARRSLQAALHASLAYPPFASQDCWQGLGVTARLMYLLLGSCVLLGDWYTTLQAIPALFGISSAPPPLRVDFSIPSAIVFLAVSALYGTGVLECAGLLPSATHLFPPLSGKARITVGCFCALGFVVSLGFNALFWELREWFLINPDSTQLLAMIAFPVFGTLLTGASVLALWAIVIGLLGLWSVLLWLVTGSCSVLVAACSLLPSLLDTIAVFLSSGKMGVYQTFVAPPPYRLPDLVFARPWPWVVSSQTHVTVIQENTPVTLLPQPLSEDLMHHLEKTASVVCIGPFGATVFPYAKTAITLLTATDSILTSAVCDLHTPHLDPGLSHILDLSPSQAEKRHAILHSRSEEQTYAGLMNNLGERLVEVHLKTKTTPAPLMFFIDSSLLPSAVSMLESVKRRLQLYRLLVITSASVSQFDKDDLRQGLAAMQALHAKDVIETCLILDPRSPFALSYGEETQLRFTCKALLSFLLSHTHSVTNRSFAKILEDLHVLSPFSALRFASEVIAVGRVPKRWAWLPSLKDRVGMGDLQDILTQIRQATYNAIEDETAAAFPSQIIADQQAALVVSIPLTLRDSRLDTARKATALAVSQTYPQVMSLTISGNGAAYPNQEEPSPYLVQASCLYPLRQHTFVPEDTKQPSPPASVQELLQSFENERKDLI